MAVAQITCAAGKPLMFPHCIICAYVILLKYIRSIFLKEVSETDKAVHRNKSEGRRREMEREREREREAETLKAEMPIRVAEGRYSLSIIANLNNVKD